MSDDERWLAFTPRDTVLVRDGRSFDAGADASAESVRPWPSTVAGAVRAAYGKEPRSVRGPVLARRVAEGWSMHFPVPADIVCGKRRQRAFLLRPEPELSGVATDLGERTDGLLVPPPGVGKVEPMSDWVEAPSLRSYLHGELPAQGFGLGRGRGKLAIYQEGADPFRTTEPLVPEPRVGLARTRERAAREGYLYQAVHLRPREGWAFLACCDVSAADGQWDASGPTPLGGRGRIADVHDISGQSGVAWPEPPETFPGGRVLVYLATPALWPDGWRPPLPADATLAGAAVPAAQPVASASPYTARRDGKRMIETVTLRWAVPAGAVYLLQFPDPDRAAAWASHQHARPFGPPRAERLDTAGFGVVLVGRWHPHSTKGPDA